MTKAEIIAAILEGQTDSEIEVNEAQPGLGPIRRVGVLRDRVTGEVLSREHIAWTYYPTGEVDTITISHWDATGKETERLVIRHSTSGSQPMVGVSR